MRSFLKEKIIICCHNARSFYATNESDDSFVRGIAMNIITTHEIFSSLVSIKIIRQHPNKTIQLLTIMRGRLICLFSKLCG